jgi:UDP-N-acetylglucosamine/UDP-N-acetylgalactosamine diphosphorylase
MDLNTGQRVEPAQPNAVKLEAFIFDALPLAERAILFETSRAEEFSPVKNATGVDSIDTAQRDISRRAAAWLARAGVVVPRIGGGVLRCAADATLDGQPDGVFEISPLYALDAEDLIARSPKLTLSPAARVYLE